MNRVSLRLSQLSYDNILRDISLEWSQGQMVGVIGPNGAGKSTLLRLATGIWRPSRGEVFANDRPIQKLSDTMRAHHIAYLPQQMPDNIYFTVEQYVEMGRYAYRTKWGTLNRESRLKVANAMKTFNLAPYKDMLMQHLSGGEQQRAGIARCIAQGSPIIVLDEPTSSLDLHFQLDILTRLQKLAQEGYLVVLAIHNLELAARYCTDLVLLDSGSVRSQGSPKEVLTEQALRDVFRVEARTYADPYGGFLRLTHFA